MHVVDVARQMFIDEGKTLRQWQALTWSEKYFGYVVKAESVDQNSKQKQWRDKQKTKKPKGKGNWRLSWEDVCDIREMRKNGAKLKEIGNKYKIAGPTISDICNYKTRVSN
jgi:hypothetical protein